MTSNPQQFDVLVMPNLYGDIIDNLGAGQLLKSVVLVEKNTVSYYFYKTIQNCIVYMKS